MSKNHRTITKSNNKANGMNEKLKVLRLLIENTEKDFSIRQIALARRINYKSAYEIVKKLEKEGVIDVKKYGNTSIVKFNNNFNESIFIVENQRRQDFLKNKNFKIIYKRLAELNFPFIALLFGSHAKGKATKHSDIDLLIVCEEKRERQIQEVLDLFPLKIHPTFTKFEDFMLMLKTKEFNVVSEAVKNNIILIGIEDYYRLIKNAE